MGNKGNVVEVRGLTVVRGTTTALADVDVTIPRRQVVGLLGASGADIDRALDAVDLVSHAERTVSTLSGGERSRVSLAAALLGSPELLVLDEPTVGLDPVLRRDLWDLFAHLRDSGVSLVVSSHVMDEAARCDRLLLLREGALLADATPRELLERTGTTDAGAAFLALVEPDGPA